MYKIKIISSYCMPALLALSLLLYGYYDRTQEVTDTIMLFKKKVEANSTGESLLNGQSDVQSGNSITHLIRFLESSTLEVKEGDGVVQKVDINEGFVRQKLFEIWLGNSFYIAAMVMLPYILFGSRLAFSGRIKLSPIERLETTYTNWWMKFIVACVIALGWVYVLNSTGRGESTLTQFLIKVDFSQHDSIPVFIQSMGMAPVIAGFLGWYLYMLTYFFSKLVHHDVVSARVYSLMFKKFLFTYGIAMIIPSVEIASSAVAYIQTGQGQSVLMFFIGYFPLAAFSMLKEKGLKLGGDLKTDTGYLSELPGISRWQVLRLEEEGIDNMAALAYASQKRLREGLLSMATILNLWIDIAQLYVVVGHDAYQKLMKRCKSASGFINKVKQADAEFVKYVQEQEIGDADEICRLLERTFGDKLIAYGD